MSTGRERARKHDGDPALLGLPLTTHLKWVRGIKDLSGASACRSSSFENRLQKTVEENFDAAACSLSLTRQLSTCKRCLGDSYGAFGRLVTRFRSRQLANSLPQRNCFHAAFAALLQVSLQQLFLLCVHSLIHEIAPL